jgi:hypothetical protein
MWCGVASAVTDTPRFLARRRISTDVARRDVLHVDVRAGVGGEDDVARDDDVFGGVRPAT